MTKPENEIERLKKENEKLKQENEELNNELELFNSLFDQIPDTIYFKDEECKFIKINKAQANALGIKNRRML